MERTLRVRKATVAASVAALALLVFSPTLTFEFVYDDISQIVGNPWVWDPGHLFDMLTRPVWSFQGEVKSNYFRPVQMLVYFIDGQLFGRQPFGFHLTNVLINGLAAAVAFLLLGGITTPARAAAAACLFAVHPAHVESVAWISGSTDVNCGLLVFATLVSSLGLRTSSGWRALAGIGMTAALSFAALMAKETAVVTPILAFALAAWSPGADDAGPARAIRIRHAVALALAFASSFAAYLLVRVHAFGGLWNVVRHTDLSKADLVASALSLLPRYLIVAFLPLRLVPDRVFDPPSGLLDPWSIAGLALLAAAAILVVTARHRAPAVAFATLLLILPLLPVLQVQLLGDNAQADRYLYISSLGACLLVVECGSAIRRRWFPRAGRRAVMAAFVVLVALAITRTVSAASIWRDNETLGLAAIRLEPRTATMRLFLSGVYESKGRMDQAWRLASEAAHAHPEDRNAAAVALALRAQNEARTPEEEIALLRRALGANPGHPYPWAALSAAYLKARRFEEARNAASQALEINSANAQVHVNLASALAGLGDHAGQEREAERALQIDPLCALAWVSLGEARLARGAVERHAQAMARAVELDPDLARARLGLSMAAWQQGRMEEALREADRARELAPRDPESWVWRGVLLQSAGNLEGARGAWEQALALDPENRAARKYLDRIGAK